MRVRLFVTISALLLASAGAAQAQDPPTKPEPPAVPSNGLVDVGFRLGDVDGDEARFERYRDLRQGAASWFEAKKYTDSFRLEGNAFNVGYRDQSYNASFTNGKLSVSGMFDSLPLNFLYDAPLIWTGDGQGRFTLPAGLRSAVEGCC